MENHKRSGMHSTDPNFPLMASERFLETMGNDPELCLSILETALNEATEQVAQISELSERSDRESARAVLHSLRGGSATFEAAALGAVLQKMETACEVDGLAPVLPLLGVFEIEARRYREGLVCLVEEIRAMR
jgi:HPt (histidine-containing phosphotransfer) domain-containing protein